MRSAARSQVAVVLTFAVVCLTACSSGNGYGSADDPSAKEDVSPTRQLLARPTTEQAVTMYQDRLVRVRAALAKLAPNVAWDDTPPQRTRDNACREPFSDVDGSGVFGYATGGGGAIPDEDWNRAIKITGDILKTEGYDRVQVIVNKPGLHEAAFSGQYGNLLTVSGQRSTSIELSDSGCFLSAEAHAAERARLSN